MAFKRSINFTYIFFMLGLFSYGQSKDTEIRNYLNQLSPEDFSGAILVAHNDSVIQKIAYGLSSIEFGAKNNVDTKFNIASITKMITAVATLQLYEGEKVELKKPIGAYLPNYPNELVKNSVTIHQLLTHTSGYNNNLDFWKTNNLAYNKVSDFAKRFEKDTLLSTPGTKYDYSASGYVILGLIIERVSGLDYYEYVRKHIFKVANMTNTSELDIDAIVPNKANGYNTFLQENRSPRKNDYYLAKASPAGFHYSTVEDLYKFLEALRNYKLLKKQTIELMFEPKVKGYNTHLGYGIDADLRYDQTILGHSGGWYGVRGELMHFVNDNYTVVILSNIDDDGSTGTTMVSNYFKELIAGKRN
ncbi:serine hydrolase [Maribacter sp. 4U21]|uniref:serine hydrolase domain-containing protein n=1 Tax=Maribacter sp. 4U21 TaxID=1889779 RepID=UPI000C1493BC|nr:serine hydrolase domain-containing protein [Maribacter sp. 4U21]PIB30697.1 serine hydrolase [Maribacter sp. 4U21]